MVAVPSTGAAAEKLVPLGSVCFELNAKDCQWSMLILLVRAVVSKSFQLASPSSGPLTMAPH